VYTCTFDTSVHVDRVAQPLSSVGIARHRRQWPVFLSPVVDSAGSNLAPVVVGRPGDRVVLDYQAWDPASLSTCGVDGADRLGSVGPQLTEVRVLRQDHEGHLPTLADEQILGLVVGQVEVRNVDVRALGRLGVARLEARVPTSSCETFISPITTQWWGAPEAGWVSLVVRIS
jgi:hypothetical protein